MKLNTPYPFSAIVGQERMKKALLLNAINPRIGGVLIKGEKGTAKSTIVRALANLLPEIEVVEDCVFGCNPHDKNEMCSSCLEKKGNLKTKLRRMKVIDLPVGATEDRVVGTLDIEHAIKKGEKKFEPGLLAQAHRNILYVDEVNLLEDHIVDVLLDVAAMGINIIEREGVSYAHPSSFILVGTMNPEEGELRPQLLDRFGLCVQIEGIKDIDARMEIVKRRLEYESDPESFFKQWSKEEEKLRENIIIAKQLLSKVNIDEEMLKLIAKICIDMQVDGHRADITMMKTAITLAAFHKRTEVEEEDVKEAAELVLPHRMRRKPFSEQKIEKEKIENTIKKHKQEKHTTAQESNSNSNTSNSKSDASTETIFEIGEPFKINNILNDKRNDFMKRKGSGKRSRTISEKGRYVKSKLPEGKVKDLAFDATLRAAAPYQIHRDGEFAIKIKSIDLREKIREKKIGNTLLFVVDASGSMGAQARMSAVKSAILSLLIDAYQKRDKVGMVAFKGNSAEVLLPPTSSVELAKKYLQTLPTGGKTPLAMGLLKSYEILTQEIKRNKNTLPYLILISDGRANVSMGIKNPLEEAKEIASQIKATGIKSLVIDVEQGISLGCVEAIAHELGSNYIRLEELNDKKIVESVMSI